MISQTFLNSLEHKDTATVINNFYTSYDSYLLLIDDYKNVYPELNNYLSKILDNANEYIKGITNYYRRKEHSTFSLTGLKSNK